MADRMVVPEDQTLTITIGNPLSWADDSMKMDLVLSVNEDDRDYVENRTPSDTVVTNSKVLCTARFKKPVKCWKCRSFGHVKRNCLFDKWKMRTLSNILCYSCRAKGHVAAKCPFAKS